MGKAIARASANRKPGAGGFTLIELAIVMIILAIVYGVSIEIGMSQIETAKATQTRLKLDRIEEALLAYRTTERRLPCPGDLALLDTDSGFGVSAGNPGQCTGDSVQATHFTAGVVAVEGAVPYATLGLPQEFMFDGWGRRLIYAVDVRMTEPEAFDNYDIYDNCGGITVTGRSTSAVYALASFGPNGHGAYGHEAENINAGSADSDELTNCNCTAGGVYDGTYDPVYVQREPDTGFDDMVRFKERWELAKPADSEGNPYLGPELAVAHNDVPYVTFYTRSCTGFTALTGADAPDTSALSDATSIAISPNNNYWAVGYFSSPFVALYRRNISTGALSLLPDPATIPPAGVTSVAFSPTGNYFAAAGAGSFLTRYITMYKVDKVTDAFTFLTGADGPSVQPTSAVSGVAFSPGDVYMGVSHSTPPYYVSVYKRSSDAFTAVSLAGKMATPPAGAATGIAFSDDGRYMAVSHALGSGRPFSVYIIDAATDTFTKVDDPALPGSLATSVSFSLDSRYLAVTTSNGTQSLYIYRVDATTDTLTLISGADSSYGALQTAGFSLRMPYIAQGGSGATRAAITKYIPLEEVFTLQAAGTLTQPPGTVNGVAWRHNN